MARLTLYGMLQYDPTLFEGMVLPPDYDRDALLSEILKRSGQLYPYHQVPEILKADIRLWFSRNYLGFDRSIAALMAEYNPIENYDRVEAWTRTPNLTDKSTLSGKDSTAASGKDSTQASGTDSTQASGTDSVQLSGTDSVQASGTDSDQLSGTDTTERTHTNYKETTTYKGSDDVEKQVSAFDSASYQPAEKTITGRTNREDEKETSGSYADGTTYGKLDEITYGRLDETTYGKLDETTYGKLDETTYGRLDETTYGRKDETTYGKVDTVTHNGTESYRSNIHGNIGVTTNQQMITAELELRKYDIYSDIAARFEHEFIVQVY